MTLLSMYYSNVMNSNVDFDFSFFVGAFSVVVQRLKTVLFGLSV